MTILVIIFGAIAATIVALAAVACWAVKTMDEGE